MWDKEERIVTLRPMCHQIDFQTLYMKYKTKHGENSTGCNLMNLDLASIQDIIFDKWTLGGGNQLCIFYHSCMKICHSSELANSYSTTAMEVRCVWCISIADGKGLLSRLV